MNEEIVHYNDSPHSIEISRNASGGVSFAVKVYRNSPQEAVELAKILFAKLDSDYPPLRK